MSQSNAIQVSNISAQTSADELRNFFSFCGRVSNLSFTPPTKSATVTFENTGAVKTALLLDNSQLGESQIHVTQASGDRSLSKEPLITQAGTLVDDGTGSVPIQQQDDDAQNVPITIRPQDEEQSKPFAQHEKPMRRILAEYLAHGYRIADQIIERGMEYDQREGFTAAFKQGLSDFDKKFAEWDQKHHANDKVRELDEKHHFTRRATETWNGAQSYFEKALGTPTGQKLRRFYEEKAKEVKDVHEEARHLASMKDGGIMRHHHHHHIHRYAEAEGGPAPETALGKQMLEEDKMEKGEECKCDEHNGTTNCSKHGGAAPEYDSKGPSIAACKCDEHNGTANCPKHSAASQATKVVNCKCGSDAVHCPCPAGTCGCANCAKNTTILRAPAEMQANKI